MKRSTKLLLSIFSIFIVTIGIIGLVYGFGDKNGHAAADQSAPVVEQTKLDIPAKNKASKVDEDKSEIQESNEAEQVDVASNNVASNSVASNSVASNSVASSTKDRTPAKNSTVPSTQKPVEKKQTVSSSKQEETSQPSPKTSSDKSPTIANGEQKNENPEKSDKPKDTSDTQTPALSKVSLSIMADKETGTILPATTVEIKEGDTVLDVLIKMTREKKIPMSFRGGTGATAYVEGIDNLFEFDKGQGSGWMFRVNGIFPNRGAGVIPLLNGDRIEWLYTLDLGKDLGAELKPFR
ncbi:DUF4430 domain-containing protein [Neobacillus sp. NPDC058068]|uniref:DUF4430 domain-containing protein n=1 Tax=Neobacillus sp. NPDC058068 TaxID=3346325 RepID=UPI0036D87FDA